MLDKSSILSLTPFVLGCFLVAAIGSIATARSVQTWYRGIEKPTWNPPDWIFGPVWTTLYVLMAIAAWRVTESSNSPARTAGLGLFVVQLGLNLAWSWIFFHRHAIGSAAIEVALLWVAIGATTLVFSRVSTTAAWLMAPYWAWVTFASILNASIWRLNPSAN